MRSALGVLAAAVALGALAWLVPWGGAPGEAAPLGPVESPPTVRGAHVSLGTPTPPTRDPFVPSPSPPLAEALAALTPNEAAGSPGAGATASAETASAETGSGRLAVRLARGEQVLPQALRGRLSTAHLEHLERRLASGPVHGFVVAVPDRDDGLPASARVAGPFGAGADFEAGFSLPVGSWRLVADWSGRDTLRDLAGLRPLDARLGSREIELRPGDMQSVTVALGPQACVTGRVTRRGVPLVGVAVHAARRPGERGAGDETDEGGHFTVRRLQPGPHDVTLVEQGQPRIVRRTVEIERGAIAVLDVELRGAPVELRAHDVSSGRPVPGVRVQVTKAEPGDEQAVEPFARQRQLFRSVPAIRTGLDGRARFELPPGTWRVHVDHVDEDTWPRRTPGWLACDPELLTVGADAVVATRQALPVVRAGRLLVRDPRRTALGVRAWPRGEPERALPLREDWNVGEDGGFDDASDVTTYVLDAVRPGPLVVEVDTGVASPGRHEVEIVSGAVSRLVLP